jgi:hypothetical protein
LHQLLVILRFLCAIAPLREIFTLFCPNQSRRVK